MTGILDLIDNATDGLCPCGGEPRPGSIYCSEDCVPNHHGAHTTSDIDGTAMRWRPDLVTEDLDEDTPGRVLVDERRRGPFRARTYADTPLDRIYCRLDDGNRYVGLYVAAETAEEEGLERTWARLERELTDRRRVEAGPVPARTWSPPFAEDDRLRICEWLRANGIDPNDVPSDTEITIDEAAREIRLDVAARRDGELVVDGYILVREQRNFPLAAPWPTGVHYQNLTILRERPPMDAMEAFRERVDEFMSAVTTSVASAAGSVTVGLDNTAGTFRGLPGLNLNLPEGSLLDGLTIAEMEARARQRALRLVEQVPPPSFSIWGSPLIARYLIPPSYVQDPRAIFRIIATA